MSDDIDELIEPDYSEIYCTLLEAAATLAYYGEFDQADLLATTAATVVMDQQDNDE